ncbi:MAG: hypothetical protein C0404_06390 [Verrucomicrobia bacterium]|nr:hypothetical protein [Verrucomicrobiota bacterium]
MFLWTARFQTAKPIESLPCLRVVSSETIVSPAYRHYGKDRAYDRHCIFKYTISGEGVFMDANGEHRVPAGSGFLCEIRDPRTAYFYPPGGSTPWTFAWMAFDGGVADQMLRGIVNRHGSVFAMPKGCPEIKRMLEFRKDDGRIRSITAAWGAKVVMDLLLALTASREEYHEDGPEDILVRRAQEAVAENVGKDINVTELARMLNISREYLTRKFKEHTAMTPHEYIIRRKILLACQLLKETSLSNKEIASRLGYGEPAHFTRTFKHAMHSTPSRFRATGIIPVV